MTDTSPLWKVGILAAVVVVAVASFVGGGYTYGTLSDRESASVEIGAAANFGTDEAGNTATSEDDDGTSGSAGNTGGAGNTETTQSISFAVGMPLQTDASHTVRSLPGGVP
jgi:hypothetical protein